jgi:cytochrome c oxidase cbb3-type subunit 2
MPAWAGRLDEKQVWQIIQFLDDEIRRPRVAADARTLYTRHCAPCHGAKGDGNGPAADLFYPRPRDFTLGLFKYRSLPLGAIYPSDDDLGRIIRDGLPGTAMAGWKDTLDRQSIDGLIGLIKGFGDWADHRQRLPPNQPLGWPKPPPQGMVEGEHHFAKVCEPCHGEEGRGNVVTSKILKDDWGQRIWPRNLTRPDTFRWVHNASDVFHLIGTGVGGTPMAEMTKELDEMRRWYVASRVMALGNDMLPPVEGRATIRARRVEGDLPRSGFAPAWQSVPPATVRLAPNVLAEPRLFHSLLDAVAVRALHNGREVAIRLDIDDRTFSVPGHNLERRHANPAVTSTPDATAVQIAPAFAGSRLPDLRHGVPGQGHDIWLWRAASVEPERSETVAILDSDGPTGPPKARPQPSELVARAEWRKGQWRIVFVYPLQSGEPADVPLAVGAYHPVAFAAWDGWAGHAGGRHALSDWHWLVLEAGLTTAR